MRLKVGPLGQRVLPTTDWAGINLWVARSWGWRMTPRGFPGLESMPNLFTESLTVGTPATGAQPHESRFSGRSKQEDLSGGLMLCYVPQLVRGGQGFSQGIALTKIACGP
jgi:hypothetical protein